VLLSIPCTLADGGPLGRLRTLGAFVCQGFGGAGLAVEAGPRVWGFPLAAATVTSSADGERAGVAVAVDGAEVLRLEVPARGRPVRRRAALRTYGLTEAELVSAAPEVAGQLVLQVVPGRAQLVLGDQPAAATLRGLGVRAGAALGAMWIPDVQLVVPRPDRVYPR
jgi:hypothetical protein